MLGPYKSNPLRRRARTGGRPPAIAAEIDGGHPQRFRADPMNVLHAAMVSPMAWSLDVWALEFHPAATTCAHGLATARNCRRDRRWPSQMPPRGSNERFAQRHGVPDSVVIECLGHTSVTRCDDVRIRVSDRPRFRTRPMVAIPNASARVQETSCTLPSRPQLRGH